MQSSCSETILGTSSGILLFELDLKIKESKAVILLRNYLIETKMNSDAHHIFLYVCGAPLAIFERSRALARVSSRQIKMI